MKIRPIYFLFIFLAGCAGSPLQTSVEAEKNRMQIGDVRLGMNQAFVRNIMGPAYKKEIRIINAREYEVWYYLTKGTLLDQTRYLDENFTPFIFSENALVGWGWKYFNRLFEESVRFSPQDQGVVPEKDQKLEEAIKKILQEESQKNLQPQETAPTEAPTFEEPEAQMPEQNTAPSTSQETLKEKALKYQNEEEETPSSNGSDQTEVPKMEKEPDNTNQGNNTTSPSAANQNLMPKSSSQLPKEAPSEKIPNSEKALNGSENQKEETQKGASEKTNETYVPPSCEKHDHPDNYNWWE